MQLFHHSHLSNSEGSTIARWKPKPLEYFLASSPKSLRVGELRSRRHRRPTRSNTTNTLFMTSCS
ncbi:hypothetical protein [Stenotrophomonas sp.]|uniref:hypothetical protein n=1 Tax=Stenotrophomonas sp. TaxID=69392 RepID=UPI0028AE9C3E|nr:hypothetical protein [Stenotrophomonas sp.]